jgi:hypothetical protein
VKENNDSVEVVIKNTSTLFEILKNSQPRSRTPPTSLKNCTVCKLVKMLKIVNGPQAYNRPFNYGSDFYPAGCQIPSE